MGIAHEFDFCVLGGGSAGYAAAVTARTLGKSVAIADATSPLGGLCILRGCMPSKTLLRSAEIAHLMKVAPALGVTPANVRIDVPAVIQRKRRIIGEFADYRVEQLQKFPLFLGEPRFTGPAEVTVGEDIIRASRFLIATGSIINVPPVPGLVETGYLTSDDVLELEKLPKSVVVLGGGDVAVELAQYLARMGVVTTMIQRSATILSAEDADVGESLRMSLEKEGIRIFTSATIRSVEKKTSGKSVVAQVGGSDITVDAEQVFLAAGRRPYVEGFGFEEAGVAYGREGVKVDEHLRTTNPNILAAGDVTGNWELVHVAVHGGELAARNAFSSQQRTVNYDLWVARAVFTDPQIGIAGLIERQCQQRGIEYEKATYAFADLGKAITAELTDGFIKMLAAPDGRILGVTIVGAEASDLIHEAIALIYFGAKCHDVLQMPHLHPTLAEIITYPAEELCERIEHQRHVVVTP
ncbi:MAG: FAD-dependent oxidoreductase [Candidatus Eremiobacteraeota bacterium]|nr:FAD-dependent oxidoreductase [Candidatus Eremiobacteraeota bacterium]